MVTTLAGKRHNYYEGILQLREVNEEFIDAVVRTVEGSGKAQISKIETERNGVDIYLSDQHYVQSLGKLLKARFGGELVVTKKMYGMHAKHGTVVYRVTVLFRKLPFNVGDVITTDDGDVKVIAIKGKVNVRNIKSGKKALLRFEQLARFATNTSGKKTAI